ncbi:MAG: CheY-like chemotaxis protein [Planctomycetota bacterium]|jgi:CheY-like chemotaxis protein
MRLETVDASLIERAVSMFLDVAWGDLAEAHWPKSMDFSSGSRDEVLRGFVDEKKRGCMRKFSLRLGNRRYPFMKMVFQELLFRDCFFFSVDTHDELDIKATNPDYQEWLAIKHYNIDLKNKVEEVWRQAEIPTLTDILDRVDEDDVPERQMCTADPSPLIFVVDDEKSIAEGVSRTLKKRNYEVEVFHCAEEAMPRIRERSPDLIVSDLEMGDGDTGLEFCERLRKDPQLSAIPFILATAAGIDLSNFELIDGFIVKPYEVEVLCAFVAKNLATTPH